MQNILFQVNGLDTVFAASLLPMKRISLRCPKKASCLFGTPEGRGEKDTKITLKTIDFRAK